jgi:hypothetical protein
LSPQNTDNEFLLSEMDSDSMTPKFTPDFTNRYGYQEPEEIPEWSKLTFADKAKLFSYWAVVNILACVMIFVGSIFMLVNTKEIHHEGELILGMGTLLIYVTAIKYYESTPGYNIVLTTLQRSSKIVYMAVVGMLPVFIGFGLLGMCLFWRSRRFIGFSSSMFCLFALMNGDAMFDTFYDLSNIDFILSQIYLYLFVSLSILVIQNVFIVIIEDGYMISKLRNKNDWLKPETYNMIPEGLSEHQKVHLRGNDFAPQINNSKVKEEVSQENPFAKMNKKKKKQRTSRDTLVKMLWHDKASIYRQRNGLPEENQASEASLPYIGRLPSEPPVKRRSVIRDASDSFIPTDSARLKTQDLVNFTLASYNEEIKKNEENKVSSAEVKAKYQRSVTEIKRMIDQLQDGIS